MKKALVVWGGWEGHEPKQCVDIFIPLLEQEGYEVNVSDTPSVYADTETMNALDLIVQCVTNNHIKKDEVAGLIAAVEGGVGLAGWHGGICASYRGELRYNWMTGGQFVGHPGGIKEYTVNIVKKDDPVMRGFDDFTVVSEQYYMIVDPAVEVLATTATRTPDMPWVDGTVIPQVWKRQWGKGRVFNSALGHVAKEFENEPVREIMRRGMLWASR